MEAVTGLYQVSNLRDITAPGSSLFFFFFLHDETDDRQTMCAVADLRPGPPTPVKTSKKKDGRCAGPQVSRVIGAPLGQISGSATGVLHQLASQ